MARAYRNRSVLLIAFVAAGCTPAPSVEIVDLMKTLPSAERRATRPIDEAVRADLNGPEKDLRPAIITDAPARVIWSIRLPTRARLETAVTLIGESAGQPGAGASARIGISDDRRYDQLAKITLDGSTAQSRAWQPISIDLGSYSGWQWSLFYRPWERTWRLIFSADATPGGTIAWARPVITGKRR